MRKGKGKNMKELMENCKAMLLLEVIFSFLYVSSLHVYIVFSSATLCILYMEPSYLDFPMKYYKELGLLLCGFFLITTRSASSFSAAFMLFPSCCIPGNIPKIFV